MTRLRILHVVPSDRFAGVEQFVRRLALAQAATHDVRVIGGHPELMGPALEIEGVRYHPGGSLPELVAALRSALPTVDVVNSHMTLADAAAVMSAPARGPAVVSTRHFAQRRGSSAPPWVYRLLERRLDAEISISRAVAVTIDAPSTVVHPGVDPVPPPRRPRHHSVLIAQRLQPEKHTEVGIRAFAESGLAGLGWSLEIAGAGPAEEMLRDVAARAGVSEAVSWLGFRPDVRELMREAGMLLATSPFEHFGLSVLEAMAAGLPVVATDAGGHAEMLTGLDDRALFPPDDIAAAAAALRALAEDEVGRTALGDAERSRQRTDFTLEAQVSATDAVYHAAVERRRRAS